MQNQIIPWQCQKIIEVANDLATHGSSAGSTGEIIAAAFVLDRMEFLPEGYAAVDAWDRLDYHWQRYVKEVRIFYTHLLVPW